MSGEEIIKQLEQIKNQIRDVNLKDATKQIDYLIEDIIMYKYNTL